MRTLPPSSPARPLAFRPAWRPEPHAERLARLVPLWPAELADRSPPGRRRIMTLLERALRGERERGRAGHWTYDLNRHIALSEALRTERSEPPA